MEGDGSRNSSASFGGIDGHDFRQRWSRPINTQMSRLEQQQQQQYNNVITRRTSCRKRKPPVRYGEDEESATSVKRQSIAIAELYGASSLSIKLEVFPEDSSPRSPNGTRSKKPVVFPLKQLPVEVLLYICSFLDARSVCSMAKVCRAFRTVSNDPSIWKGLSLRRWRICDAIMYDFNWKELFSDRNRRTQRGWFRYEVKDFSKKAAEASQQEGFYSEPFEVGTHQWSVLIFPRGNASTGPFLSVYLSVKNTAPLGPREASFSFLLRNHKYPSKNIQRDSLYAFFVAVPEEEGSEHEDWGFTRFIELDKLTDEQEGYLKNDSFSLDVYVCNLIEIDYWIKLLNSGDEALQLEASNAIVQSSFVDENKLVIVKKGGMEALLKMLYSENYELQRNASDALWNLTVDDYNKNLLVELGALPRIIEILKCSNSDIQKNIINVCWNISTIDPLKQKIVKIID
eukprot:TRINITY_DN10609_c0_g1_i2.p1 TRINITY_DN10609_c0_g1~~TRINITY_DN10609_c0_g1_i2.p1  ORF type:complete len:457 (+),score=73.17 TRINITY_DN10609_c0_g1_i2:140-1510(+)